MCCLIFLKSILFEFFLYHAYKSSSFDNWYTYFIFKLFIILKWYLYPSRMKQKRRNYLMPVFVWNWTWDFMMLNPFWTIRPHLWVQLFLLLLHLTISCRLFQSKKIFQENMTKHNSYFNFYIIFFTFMVKRLRNINILLLMYTN